jgi:hypothetical protein
MRGNHALMNGLEMKLEQFAVVISLLLCRKPQTDHRKVMNFLLSAVAAEAPHQQPTNWIAN